MSKQRYDDTTEGFRPVRPEHELGLLAELTRPLRGLVVPEMRRQASSQQKRRESYFSKHYNGNDLERGKGN